VLVHSSSATLSFAPTVNPRPGWNVTLKSSSSQRASKSRFVRAEHEIEPWPPGLPAIRRRDCCLAHTSTYRLPGAANQSLFSTRPFCPNENHFLALHPSLDHQQLSTIGYPALVPYFSRSVIDVEALPLHSLSVLVVFAKNTAVKQAIYPRARYRRR